MELNCKCGEDCILRRDLILKKAHNLYEPCENCQDPLIDKGVPLVEQFNLEIIDRNWGKCKCGKRHLDNVMGHVLKVMIEELNLEERSNLRDVGTPLITPAYPLSRAPFIPPKCLVLLSQRVDEKTANRIIDEVPEIKGVIKGDPRQIIGIIDSKRPRVVYEKLAGCDMRCDIIKTPRGPICIYKEQSRMHIEFPRAFHPKIMNLYNVLRKLGNSPLKVIDATCGPGTLGIFALLAGAEEVIFNDISRDAVEMTAINLEVNGFNVIKDIDRIYGENFEVYNEDIKNLYSVLDGEYDLCIIDLFPGVDSHPFIKSCEKIANEILLIH